VYTSSREKQKKNKSEFVGTAPLEKYQRKTRGSLSRFYGFTETGYINKQLFEEAIHKFIDQWTLMHPGLDVFLIGDQLGSHFNIDLIEYAMQKNVFMWFFAANSSHFLQPLDSTPFALFKKSIKEKMDIALLESVFT
jgi:hypothetical protein